MDELSQILKELSGTLTEYWHQTVAFSPKLLSAIFLIALGWIVARILKAFSTRLVSFANRVLNRFLPKGSLSEFQLSSKLTNSFSKIIFWAVLIFFATAATEILGLDAFSIWLRRLVTYFPQIFAGVLIIVFGVLLSTLGRDLTLSATEATHIVYSRILGRVAQGLILVTAIIIGLDQIGIEVSFIVTLLSIVLGAFLGSFALALGLGTKDLVSNLISGHQLQKVYQPGQHLKFGGVDGIILEMNPTSMVLSTKEGRMIVPAKFFHTDPSLLVIQETQPDE